MVRSSKKNILILGAAGLLGASLSSFLIKYFNVFITYNNSPHIINDEYMHMSKRIDITDRESLQSFILKANPNYIINCAALTDVDLCENNKSIAYDVNVAGMKNLLSATSNKCKIIHISTDYIFDGKKQLYTEDDIPNPISYYGKTKLESENILRGSKRESLILRTSVLFNNSSNNNFYSWVRGTLENNKEIHVVTDQVSNPTWTWSFSEAIFKSIISNLDGVLHFAGNDILSRYEFAIKIANSSGLDPNMVIPISTEELNQQAPRPLYTALSTNKIKKLINIEQPSLDFILEKLNMHIKDEIFSIKGLS